MAQFIARFGDMTVSCFRRIDARELLLNATNALNPLGRSAYSWGADWIEEFIQTWAASASSHAPSAPPPS